MKDKSIHAYIRLWTISSVIAACTLILTYLIFNVFLPGPIYLEELAEPYNAKRAAAGMIVFLIATLILSSFKESRYLHKPDNESIKYSLFENKYLEISTLALRLTFAGYLVMFWYNYLLYIWFSKISLSFAYTYSSLYYQLLIGCLSLVCAFGAFWTVYEPWNRFMDHANKRTVYRNLLIRVVIYIAINLFVSVFSVFEFPADIGYLIVGTTFIVFISVAIVFLARRWHSGSRSVQSS